MLTSTFLRLPGIGMAKERALWAKGILTWENFNSGDKTAVALDEYKRQLQERNAAYFAEKLGKQNMWRLFPEFQDSTAYLSLNTRAIITAALYDGKTTKTYVKGVNLETILEDIAKYTIIVYFTEPTHALFIGDAIVFNPRETNLPISLRDMLVRLGIECHCLEDFEQRTGIEVDSSLSDFDKHDAAADFTRSGDRSALEALLAKQCSEVHTLEQLAVWAYNKGVSETSLGSEFQMPVPVLPTNPFKVDPELVAKYTCRTTGDMPDIVGPSRMRPVGTSTPDSLRAAEPTWRERVNKAALGLTAARLLRQSLTFLRNGISSR